MVAVAKAAATGRAGCQPRNALCAVPGLPSAPCPDGGGQAPVHAGEFCQPWPRGPRAVLAGAERARSAPSITAAGPGTKKLKNTIKPGGASPPRAKDEAGVGHRAAGATPRPCPEPPGACDSPSRGVPLRTPCCGALHGPWEAEAFKMAAEHMGKARHRVTGASSCGPEGSLSQSPALHQRKSPKHRGEPSRAGGHLLR